MKSVRVGEWLAKRRKWLVTVATFLAGVPTIVVLNGTTRTVVGVVLLALNSAGVHQVPNES